jgi:hypothetical protein
MYNYLVFLFKRNSKLTNTNKYNEKRKKMKKVTMSLVASALLVSSAYALETEAGTVSGEVSAYHTAQTEAKAGYTMASASVNFDSKDMNGFKASVGVMTNFDLAEQTDGSYGENEEDLMINVANVSYSAKDVTVIAGRQAIDLEWIGDYHTALVGVYSGVENLTLIGGYTVSTTGNANDGALADFADIGDDGAMVVDGTYKASDNLTLGAYYMTAPELFDGLGFKAETSVSSVSVTGKYAMTMNDDLAGDDGSIMAVDLSSAMGSVTVGGGFIMTDKDAGVGSIAALGDNINPLDSGNQVYGADATTLYVSAAGTAGMFDLGAIYGTTSYGSATEGELDLSASWDCKFVKDLSLSALYATIMGDTAATDETYYSVQAVYSF